MELELGFCNMQGLFGSPSVSKNFQDAMKDIGDHPFFPVIFFENISSASDQEIDDYLLSLDADKVRSLMGYAAEMYGGVPLDQLGLSHLQASLRRCFPSQFATEGQTFMEMLEGV